MVRDEDRLSGRGPVPDRPLFRRPILTPGGGPATHADSAKAWGLCLFAAFVAVPGFGKATGWMDVMIAVGCLADLEVIAIMLLAPPPAVDVPTVIHAARKRRRAGPSGV